MIHGSTLIFRNSDCPCCRRHLWNPCAQIFGLQKYANNLIREYFERDRLCRTLIHEPSPIPKTFNLNSCNLEINY
ncbi:MAG: hypothetical protein F8N35_03610 [Paludibacter sp.]|nr:hypothetical protein [Paludibacter sp.]